MNVFSYLQELWFIWLPWILGFFLLKLWRGYVQNKYISKIDNHYVLLEINLPREVHKSPQAMEIIIDLLWFLGGGAMMWSKRLLSGSVLTPSSLEIISVEGSLYFFIRTSDKLADLVKNAIYSQYPNVEVSEVEDYTYFVPDYTKNEDTWKFFGSEYKLMKPDFIPIKTYVDYGLDRAVGNLEEYEKIDPITPMIEYLASLGKGEQIWVQYLIRADVFSPWREEAKNFIKELMNKGQGEEGDKTSLMRLSPGEQELIKGIERSLHKHAFETIIRAVYLAPKDFFKGERASILTQGMFKPFSSQYFNAIIPYLIPGIAWKYQDLSGKRVPYLKKRIFRDYIKRAGFYDGFFKKLISKFWFSPRAQVILTSEELATLFHIPGRVSATPNLERIESVKSEPPQNLPVEGFE